MRGAFLIYLAVLTTVLTVVGVHGQFIVTTPAPNNPVSCNFDSNMCGWVQMINDNFDWTRQRGNTPTRETGPVADHTTGKGYYLYTEVSVVAANRTARIQSPTIQSVKTDQCLTFWYNMNGNHIGTLNVYIKSTPVIGIPEWTRTGAQGMRWIQASIVIPQAHAPYSVVFEGISGNGYRGDIAIDDVNLRDAQCDSVVVTSPVVPTSIIPGQTVRICDFEMSNICNYVQDTTDDFDWTWNSGVTSSYGTGPISDHTYGSTSGSYLFTEASGRMTGNKARLMTPVYHDSFTMCVQFYYHMYGDGMGSFNVYAKKTNGTSLGQAIFSMSGNQGNRWIESQATIPRSIATSTSGYQVVFEGTIGANYKSDIAIDDVSFKAYSCPIPGACTFEAGFCTWTNSRFKGDEFDWSQDDGGTSNFAMNDHTLGTKQGKYLIIEASQYNNPGDKAWLVSQVFQPAPSFGRCMSFWYRMHGQSIDTLNIYIRVQGRADYLIWYQTGSLTSGWNNGQVPITETTRTYSIVIEGLQGKGHSGFVAIDDIMFQQSLCRVIPASAVAPPQNIHLTTTQTTKSGPFACIFQSGYCGWTQVSEVDQFDWTLNTGPTLSKGTGPSYDHTLGHSYGGYIYIETSGNRNPGDKAQLYSPVVPAGQNCITFWYSMYGSTIGSLNVYVQTGGSLPTTPVWSRSGNHGPDWLQGQISVNVQQPYRVVFEGVRGNGYFGDIGLDDTDIKNGTCKADFHQAIDFKCFHPGWLVTLSMTELSPRPNDIRTIYMGEDSCTGKLQGDLLVFDKTYGQCNTHAKITDGKVMLSNSIQYAKPTTSQTSKDSRWEYNLQCAHALSTEGSFPMVSKLNTTSQGSSLGQGAGLPFDIRVFKDAAFKDQQQRPPVIGSPVYVQVISLSHPDVVMVVDSCEASVKAGDQNDQKSYHLIDQRCAVKTTTKVLMVKNQLTRFKFDMFDLPPNYDGIFITCDVHFCDQADLYGNCDQKCHSNAGIIG